MTIKTSDPKTIQPFIKRLYIPPKHSHKGQNGKLLIIGGSKLFHAASLWAAETASHLVDMVHYSSTKENNEIFLTLKKKFRNGIVVSQSSIPEYVKEDDVVLVGPGMVRKVKSEKLKVKSLSFEEILNIKDEAEYSYYLTRYLLTKFPGKKFVLDAGAIQMMEPERLKKRLNRAIVTPHLKEFMRLFKIDMSNMNLDARKKTIEEAAKRYECTILFKSPVDIVSNGNKTYLVEGGNAGLTKGGSGDVLASLTASFFTKNDDLLSCIFASYLVKKTAEKLSLEYGYWYNTSTVVQTIPKTLNEIVRGFTV